MPNLPLFIHEEVSGCTVGHRDSSKGRPLPLLWEDIQVYAIESRQRYQKLDPSLLLCDNCISNEYRVVRPCHSKKQKIQQWKDSSRTRGYFQIESQRVESQRGKKNTPGNRTLPLVHRIPGKVIR